MAKSKKLSDFRQQAMNANRHTERGMKALEASMNEVGYTAPMIAAADGEIIAGSARHETAASVFGADVEPVIVESDGKRPIVVVRTDIKNAETRAAKRIGLLDNRVQEIDLSFDPLVLAQLYAEDKTLTAGLWSDDELTELLNEAAGAAAGDADAEPQIDKAAELNKVWQVKESDLWQIGEHRLLCGDGTRREDVERVMMGEKANICFTDPPYGVSVGKKNAMLNSFQKAGRNLTNIVDDDLSPDELKARLLPAFINLREMVMADDCTVFMTAPQGGELGMMMMMKEAGLPIRHVLIWMKNAATFSMGRLDYDYQHEPILLTWGKRHKRPMLGTHKTSIWQIDKPRSSAEHPTMKPPELYANAYMNNSEVGDISYEPYAGSGTAFVASQNTGRKCRAIELSPDYCAVILQRMKDAFPNIEIKRHE